MRGVKRIRFVGLTLDPTDRWISLGGIRLYNKGALIQPGSLISEVGSVAETENMIVRATNKYRTHYLVQHAIMTNRAQTGSYPNNGYWLAADNTASAFYEVELKVASDVDVLEWVQRPDSQYGQRGSANPINIEFYGGDGSLIEKVTMTGNRNPDAITKLTLPSKVQKWLVETEETIKYWTGAEWSPVQPTG